MNASERRSWAYWLTLAFRLEGETRRSLNGLVLTADRMHKLGVVDLVRLATEARPDGIDKFGHTLDHLVEAEGRVTAQAFLVDRLIAAGCQIVPITHPTYPPHLVRRIGPSRAPTVLLAAGNFEIWRDAGVAISGSRKSGPKGLAFARAAGRAVAEAGQVVVCGLAAGIDREALEGALEAGGRVVGVAPEGILNSRWLRRREVEDGRLVVVSEFAPEDRWTVGRAMARNRTIAGFSRALVIADCVASGGTTDQLEVHRAAGLEVFVRTGPGEGAMVQELLRRPGVRAFPWADGPVTWPPVRLENPEQPAENIACSVQVSEAKITIHVEAPRQLTLDAVLDRVRQEYDRESEGVPAEKPAAELKATEVPPSRASDGVPPQYTLNSDDPILNALLRAGSAGASSKEIASSTTLTLPRVRERLKQLIDARLVVHRGSRYFPDDQVRLAERRHTGL